jgi:hypothetical protein
VIVLRGYFQHYYFHTLNDIPKSVLFPPETQYSLASVILTDGGHFIGISLDIRNSPGIHLIFDGIKYKHEEKIQFISLEDPLSKITPRCNVMELWYVKVDSGNSTAGKETSLLIVPVMVPAKYMDIHCFAEQIQRPEHDTGQSALPTEDKSVCWKQSSPNTHSSEQKQSLMLKSLTTKEMYLKVFKKCILKQTCVCCPVTWQFMKIGTMSGQLLH